MFTGILRESPATMNGGKLNRTKNDSLVSIYDYCCPIKPCWLKPCALILNLVMLSLKMNDPFNTPAFATTPDVKSTV